MAVKLRSLHLFFLPHVPHHYDSASINNIIEIEALSVCLLVLVMEALPLSPLILSCQSLAYTPTVSHISTVLPHTCL